VLPGFGLSLGITCTYLSLMVLLPLATVFTRTADLSSTAFWNTITDPRVLASYRVTFGASFVAASINAVIGLLVAWVLVRYRFPGKRLVDAMVDLPFALPTAVAGIALTTLYASSGWVGRYLEPLGLKVSYTWVGITLALMLIGLPLGVRTGPPVLDGLGHYLGAQSRALPGRQHVMDREYFRRIDAMQFSMAHDDGQGLTDLEEADIVLVGVSRTSKTPTSIYLANRGLKTANIPLIPNMPAPPEIASLKKPLIVALTTNPERLVQVRRNRLLALNQKNDTEYVDLELVKEEVASARRLFSQHGWPVIDVTRRSIEETAASILNLYARRQEERGEPHAAASRGDE
jgi:hypothetical protein